MLKPNRLRSSSFPLHHTVPTVGTSWGQDACVAIGSRSSDLASQRLGVVAVPGKTERDFEGRGSWLASVAKARSRAHAHHRRSPRQDRGYD